MVTPHGDPQKATHAFGGVTIDCGNGVIDVMASTVDLIGHRSLGVCGVTEVQGCPKCDCVRKSPDRGTQVLALLHTEPSLGLEKMGTVLVSQGLQEQKSAMYAKLG